MTRGHYTPEPKTAGPGQPDNASETERLIKEIDRLKKLLAEKELEQKILEDLLKATNKRSGTKSR